MRWGKETDMKISTFRLMPHRANARVELIDQAGHILQLEQCAQVSEAIGRNTIELKWASSTRSR